MTEKRGTKHRRWVKGDQFDLSIIAVVGGEGADAVQVKIQKARLLRVNLRRELVSNTNRIPNIKRYQDYLINKYEGLTQYLSRKVDYLKTLELEKDREYYEHHGRVLKKHESIREQDDIIRTSRRKLVHQRNCLAEEKRLIQEVRLAEETRAKILIAHGSATATDIDTCDSYEETQKKIEYRRSIIVEQRLRNKKLGSEIEGLDKDLKWAEKELAKINKLMEEVNNFISINEDHCILKPELNAKVSWYPPRYRKIIVS